MNSPLQLTALPVAGIEPCSLIDFPGHLSAVLFRQGCNVNCPWCHNRQLIAGGNAPPAPDPALTIADLDSFLASRRDFLDGIVVTGGEPTIHADLPDFLSLIKSHGYRIKLDTNGSNPAVLGACLQAGLVDYVAMDIKAPLDNPIAYARACGLPEARGQTLVSAVRHSLDLLRQWTRRQPAGVSYELRSTCFNDLPLSDLAAIAAGLRHNERWFLQVWRARSGTGNSTGLKKSQLLEFAALLALNYHHPQVFCRA